MAIIALIIFLIPLYAGGFLLFFLIEILRKKRVPWVLTGSNVICISFFIYLQNLIDEHRLVFIGKYEDGSMHWGKGLANVYTAMNNSLILIFIFSVTQIFFWLLYKKEIRQLRKEEMINDLLQDSPAE
jgi:hypothetical protein